MYNHRTTAIRMIIAVALAVCSSCCCNNNSRYN